MGSQPELRRERVRQAVLARRPRRPDLARRTTRRCSTARPSRAYPTGSTFKPITALAALESGLINADDTIDDTGHWELGTQKYQNAKGGELRRRSTCRDALKVSSDMFFFQLGAQAAEDHDAIQRWAKRLGFGRKTGIDLPGEAPGLVPDATWRDTAYAKYHDVRQEGPPAERTQRRRCTSAAASSAPWTPGDNVNLAVGQGDLQATPLQVAVAYSALANGGTIVRPHLGQAVEDGNGVTIQDLRTKPRRKIKIDARDRAVVLRRPAPRRAARTAAPPPTSSRAGRSATPVYGKTGTAERQPNPDQAWYACFVKDGGKPIVVVVTVEQRRLRRRNRGTRGAPDPLAVVRCEGPRVPRRLATRAIERHPSNPLPSRRPRWCRGNGGCAWTRCCCSPRSAWSPAR